MPKNPFLPIPANLDPAGPNFIATLNDRLRRIATPAAASTGATKIAETIVTGGGGGISLGSGYFIITPATGVGGVLAFVQQAGFVNAGSSSTAAQAFASNVTAGNTIVVAVACAATMTATVTDDLGNTYTQQAIKQYAAGGFTGWIFTAPVGSGGPCTVTVTFAGAATYRTLLVAEFAGVSNPVAADGSASAQSPGGGSSPYSLGPIATTNASDIIVACLAGGNSGGLFTISAGWTRAAYYSGADSIALDYIVVSATGSYTCAGTYNASDWIGLTAALKAQAAGIGSTATIDLANGPNQRLLLGATAVTILAPIWTGHTIAAGNRIYLYFDQDATGGRASPIFTLGAGAFASDTPSVVSPDSTPSTRTCLCFLFDGSIWALDGPQRTGGAIT